MRDPIDGVPVGEESPWRKWTSIVATCTGFAVSAGTVPQAVTAWTGDVSGISLITWGILTLNVTAWMPYGVAHRSRAIVAVNVLAAVTAAAVVAGVPVRG